MLYLVNDLILKFQAQVLVPGKGAAFDSLKFIDTLTTGLEYVSNSAKVEYQTTPATTFTTVDPSNIIVTSPLAPSTDLVISVNDPAITNTVADTLVTFSFEALIKNVDVAIKANTITNNYKFKIDPDGAEVIGDPFVENAAKFPFYVMGVPSTVERTAGLSLNAVYFFGGANGYASTTNNFTYNLKISEPAGFSLPSDLDTVRVTVGSATGSDVPSLSKNLDSNTINITFPHHNSIKDQIIFITVPLTTTSTISEVDALGANVVSNPALISGTAEIIASDSSTKLVVAPPYSAVVTLVSPPETTKVLESLKKILV